MVKFLKYAAEVAELYQRANLAMAQGNLAEAQEANEQLKQVINNEIAKQEDYKAKDVGYSFQYLSSAKIEVRD